MKYLLTLTLLLLCLLSFYSCGDDTINRVYTSPDFDIYLVKRDIQNSISSTYTIKSDGSDYKLFNDSLGVRNYSYRNMILLTKGGESFNEIYVANFNGNNMTNIPLGDYQAIYCNLSPNAEKLYFVTYFPTNSLFIVNVNGSEMVEISDRQYFNYGTVRFSPSGNMIAYLEPSYFPNHRGTKLFISNTSGTYKKLLKDSIQDGGFAEWSNDGKRIAYHYLSFDLQSYRICVIDTSSNNYADLADGGFPAWSPNGNKICFVDYIGNRTDIFLMNTDGTNIVNISNTTTRDESNIKWSKDGMKILYNSYEPSQPSSIFIYDLNSSSNTLLADSVSDAIWQ